MHRCLFALALPGLLLAGCARTLDVEPTTTVTPLYSASETAAGQPILLPQGPAQVAVSHYLIPPGTRLPVHKHPHQRFAYVQAGVLAVYNSETGQRSEYRAGDFVVEMVDTWHYGEALGTVPVELLVIDQSPAGDDTITVLQD